MLFEVRQNLVVKYVSCGNRRFGRVELRKRYLAVGIDEGLLVNAAYTLEVTDIECILRTKITWMHRFNFTTGLIIILFLFKCRNLCIREDNAFLGDFCFQRFQALFEVFQIVAQPDFERTPLAETNTPCLRNSLLVLTCP